VPIVLPPKRDGVVRHVDEPVVRDRDAVGVPREVVEHVGGAAKGRLGVHDPRLAIQRSQEGAKGGIRLQRRQRAREIEAPLSKGRPDAGHELAAKDFPQDRDRQEEARTGVDPPGAVRGQAAHRHDAVDVRMVLQPLAPRVQHHQPANGAAQSLRIPRDLQQGFSGRLKQEVVHHALVDEGEAGERLRHGEDEVDVASRQQLLLARRHPGVPRRRQTLWAMPIAAAVVRDGHLRALLTAITVPAERRGAALRDGPEDASMDARHPGPVLLQDAIAMSAHEVGHLEGWPGHRLCNRRVRRTVSVPDTGMASSGFATACRCRCDKCR
jgi:hypothetical protein